MRVEFDAPVIACQKQIVHTAEVFVDDARSSGQRLCNGLVSVRPSVCLYVASIAWCLPPPAGARAHSGRRHAVIRGTRVDADLFCLLWKGCFQSYCCPRWQRNEFSADYRKPCSLRQRHTKQHFIRWTTEHRQCCPFVWTNTEPLMFNEDLFTLKMRSFRLGTWLTCDSLVFCLVNTNISPISQMVKICQLVSGTRTTQQLRANCL